MLKIKTLRRGKKGGGGGGEADGGAKSRPLRWSFGREGASSAAKQANVPFAGRRRRASDQDRAPPPREGPVPPDAYLGAVNATAGFSPALLRQALIMFYATFAPEREEVTELLDLLIYFTAKSSLQELNNKLFDKYGKTLDDIELPEYDDDDFSVDLGPPPPAADEEPPPPIFDPNEEPPPPPVEQIPDEMMGVLRNSLAPAPPPLPPPDSGLASEEGGPGRTIKGLTRKGPKVRTKSFFGRRKTRPRPPP